MSRWRAAGSVVRPRAADRGAHDVERHAGGDLQDAPLALEPRRSVGVARVDLDLVRTADHEHGALDHDQGPQRVDLCIAQRLLAVERTDGGKHVLWRHAVDAASTTRSPPVRRPSSSGTGHQSRSHRRAAGPSRQRRRDVVVVRSPCTTWSPSLLLRASTSGHTLLSVQSTTRPRLVQTGRGEQGQHASGMAGPTAGCVRSRGARRRRARLTRPVMEPSPRTTRMQVFEPLRVPRRERTGMRAQAHSRRAGRAAWSTARTWGTADPAARRRAARSRRSGRRAPLR